jgi:hypothetical protein
MLQEQVKKTLKKNWKTSKRLYFTSKERWKISKNRFGNVEK